MSFDAGLKAHLATGATSVCHAWRIARGDGVVMGFTDHDRDLSFDGVTFRAGTGLTARSLMQSTGLAVDNSEALGALSSDAVREADIESGRYDGAEVRAWLVNWADTTERALQFRGSLGEIRRAGGGPLVRRDVMTLVERLGRHVGAELEELTLTTNGTQLAEYAQGLADAGIKRVNVSLDTLDPATFAKLTRRDVLPKVLAGIEAAQKAGLRVKLNTVALKDINDREIPHLIGWAHKRGCDITLIETMPLGEVDGDRIDSYLPLTAVQDDLEARWDLTPSDHKTGGPARYFDVAETGGRLGLITPLTNNFCASCNRVRVTIWVSPMAR